MFRRKSFTEFLFLQKVGSGHHRLRRFLQVLNQLAEFLIDAAEQPSAHPGGQSLRLFLQGALDGRQQLRIFRSGIRPLLIFLPDHVPCGRDHFLLPLGEESVVHLAAAAATSACLRLPVRFFEGAHLQEEHLRLGEVGRRILGDAIEGN